MSQERFQHHLGDGGLRVVFMGTPRFALPVLDALDASADVDICGVFTPPDRPGGRGGHPVSPPVKLHAQELGMEIHQPSTLRSKEVQDLFSSLAPDIIVVAAYGRFLPTPVLNLPPGGCLNLHPSLLPRHRGPSPVVTSILEGDPATGVSLMRLDEGMDTGPVIASRPYQMAGGETAEWLTEELFRMGSLLLMENLGPWVRGELTATPQIEGDATITRKVERGDGRADWSLSAQELDRRFRAYRPWPGLYAQWDGKLIKFLDVSAVSGDGDTELPPGTIVQIPGLIPLGVVTGAGVLELKTVQLEGRKSATAAEFLRGYPGFLGANL